jgi:8-oxo-dGTP pyrophosphatase MutT (NUDIX family)
VTEDGNIVLISVDGLRWSFPAGRPEGVESWEATLRREVMEEACATVVRATLLGFARGVCVAGPETGLVLVRSIWRADVQLGPWLPQFEIKHRRIVRLGEVDGQLALASHPFAPFVRRALREAVDVQEAEGEGWVCIR